MVDNGQSALLAELIDEQTTFSLADLCRACAVEAEMVEALVEQGILEPIGRRGRHLQFASNSLGRTRVTLHLQRDLGVNLAGAALALDLLDRVQELDRQLRALRSGSTR